MAPQRCGPAKRAAASSLARAPAFLAGNALFASLAWLLLAVLRVVVGQRRFDAAVQPLLVAARPRVDADGPAGAVDAGPRVGVLASTVECRAGGGGPQAPRC